MTNKSVKMVEKIGGETEDIGFGLNKIRNEITNLRNSMEWEEFIFEPIVSSQVKSYIRKNLFDFENYDYKIDALLVVNNSNGDAWNTIAIQTYLLDSNNNRLRFGNHWVRTAINENCAPNDDSQHSVTTGGYVKSQYNETVVCYGFDSNDGEDGMRMVMELIPSFSARGGRSLVYTADIASNSIWRQQFSNYRGTLTSTNNSLENVTGIEFNNGNSMVYMPGLCYLRVYRRHGGYNKYKK